MTNSEEKAALLDVASEVVDNCGGLKESSIKLTLPSGGILLVDVARVDVSMFWRSDIDPESWESREAGVLLFLAPSLATISLRSTAI